MQEMANRPTFSALGLVITAVLALALIALANVGLRGWRMDLTENRLYTLSPGTHAILNKLDEPIHLYFFYSRETAQGLPSIATYARRVQEMLEEMSEIAGDKLKLTVIDPEPFSEEEDRAVQLGIQGIPLSNGGKTLYFGLAGSNAVGESQVIPFFSSEREPLLEYDIAKLIYQLGQGHKPVVGLITTLKMNGGLDAASMRPKPAWVIVEQLRQLFELRNLDTDIREIPEEVKVLMLVHPADLKPATLYAVDQFVLRGGHLLVFTDPLSEVAGGLGGLPHQGAAPTASDINSLSEAWGVRMRPREVLGDALYALRVTVDPAKAPERDYATIGVRGEALNQDDVITQGMERVNIAYGGILERVAEATTEFTPLIRSSDQAMPIPRELVRQGRDPQTLQRGFRPSGERYVLAARISGTVKSAFPDGPPKPEQGEDQGKPPHDAADQPEQQQPEHAHLGESKGPINVVMVADTDLLSDRLWVSLESFFGRRIASPFADNGDLVVNAVDNLLGSSELISIRSRASYSRPFDRVDALRLRAEARFREKEQALQAQLRETEHKIAELQQKEGDAGGALILSDAQRKAVKGFQDELVRTRKELRTVQHRLNKDIQELGTRLKFINIALVPLLLVIGAIAWTLWRRKRPLTPAHKGGQA
jgi:ABC-type uncharacterized transport system involved in gliding motility auxiliary subunit